MRFFFDLPRICTICQLSSPMYVIAKCIKYIFYINNFCFFNFLAECFAVGLVNTMTNCMLLDSFIREKFSLVKYHDIMCLPRLRKHVVRY